MSRIELVDDRIHTSLASLLVEEPLTKALFFIVSDRRGRSGFQTALIFAAAITACLKASKVLLDLAFAHSCTTTSSASFFVFADIFVRDSCRADVFANLLKHGLNNFLHHTGIFLRSLQNGVKSGTLRSREFDNEPIIRITERIANAIVETDLVRFRFVKAGEDDGVTEVDCCGCEEREEEKQEGEDEGQAGRPTETSHLFYRQASS